MEVAETLEEQCESLIGKLATYVKNVSDGKIDPVFLQARDKLQAGGNAIEIMCAVAPRAYAWCNAMESGTKDEKRRKNLSVNLSTRDQWNTIQLAENVLGLMIDDASIKKPEGWEDFTSRMRQQKKRQAQVDERSAASQHTAKSAWDRD